MKYDILSVKQDTGIPLSLNLSQKEVTFLLSGLTSGSVSSVANAMSNKERDYGGTRFKAVIGSNGFL